MKHQRISGAVIRRLPLYLRVLEGLAQEQILISSQELGQRAGVSAAQVRKDLAQFGEFGKQGVGYSVTALAAELHQILHDNREIPVALLGVGSLGLALARYTIGRSLRDPHYFLKVVGLFDQDPTKIGLVVDGLEVLPMDRLPLEVRAKGIEIGILTVPGEQAQRAAQALVDAGIGLILNFAPVSLQLPKDVRVHNADLSLELEHLAYYSQPRRGEGSDPTL